MIVEGPTDEQFIRTAAATCKRPDLVRDLHITEAGGAQKAAVQAVLMRAQGSRPVLSLFDDDPPGKGAYYMLRQRYGFDRTRELLSYREVIGDNDIGAEAEDLFPPALPQDGDLS